MDVIEDLIEIGFGTIHLNEAKTGIDVARLREKIKDKIAYLGNIDVAIFYQKYRLNKKRIWRKKC